jgi:predicted secreted Zn-dependent protease
LLKVLLFLIAAMAWGPALALEKCVGADGKISYMDRCPAGTRAPAKTDEQLIPKAHSAPVITKPELEPLQNVMKPVPVPETPKPPAAAPAPVAVPAPAPASPLLAVVPADVKVEYYEVQGSDYASLMKSLTARTAGHAQSSWKLSYQYQPRRDKGLCSVGALTTRLELAMTLPRWTPPADASRDLVARWLRYVDALMSHENVRLDPAREMEHALKPALLGVPAVPDCAALDVAVVQRYEALREELKAREARSPAPQNLVFE